MVRVGIVILCMAASLHPATHDTLGLIGVGVVCGMWVEFRISDMTINALKSKGQKP